jgi:hypothetical protein
MKSIATHSSQIPADTSKNGISFSIFEAESTNSRPRSREWGMSIHWSRPLLKELLPDELLDKIREAQVDPTYDTSNPKGYAVPFYNAKTGEHIVDIPMVNAIRVSRRKMRALCAEGIDIQVCASFSFGSISDSI